MKIETACKLLPCPCCGGLARLIENKCDYDVGPTYYYVECSECWLATATNQDSVESIENWNNRVK